MADNTEIKKFLFDSNRFDAPDEDENDEPVVPTFSEEELEQAKKIAYESGKSQGLKEAEASREKHVATLTESIMMDIKNLFSEEQGRASTYEEEAVRLSTQIFETLFPYLNEKHGIDEIKSIIKQVLTAQSEQPSIVVEVNTEYKSDIDSFIENIKKQLHGSGDIDVIGNEELGASDCRLSWKDGGARRDTQRLCTQILNTLQDGLADSPVMDNNESVSEDADEQAQAPKEDITAESMSDPAPQSKNIQSEEITTEAQNIADENITEDDNGEIK